MTNRKPQNSILVLVLLLVGIAPFTSAQSQKAASNEINKTPLRDFVTKFRDSLESKELDLVKPFVVEYTGFISKKEKLDLTTGKFTRVEGDKKSTDIAKQAIIAVSDSGYFAYLRDLGSNNIVLLVSQNDADFTTQISSAMISEARVNSIRSIFGLMIEIVKNQKSKPDATENDKVDLLLLNATTVTADKKTVKLTLSLPKTVFHEMIKSELAKQK